MTFRARSSQSPEQFATRRSWRRLRRGLTTALSAAAIIFGSLVAPGPAQAIDPFPIDESTPGSPGSVVSGWNVPANSTSPTWTSDGWIRLNNRAQGQRMNMVKSTAFPSSAGFQFESDYRMAGGNPFGDNNGTRTGDGIAFYLIDGDAAVSSGSPGAGLGYANRIDGGGANRVCGVNAGFLGLGLDVFGNYSAGDFGNFGGDSNLRASSIVLRGSGPRNNTRCGNATNPPNTAFPLINGAKAPGLWTGVAGNTDDPAGVTNSQYRRVRIVVDPADTSNFRVQVFITPPVAKGNTPGAFNLVFSSQVNLNSVPGQRALPSTLKLGFSASSGAATDFKDIRNVKVSALADLAITKTITTTGQLNDGSQTYFPGDDFKFNLTATNNGRTAVGGKNGAADPTDGAAYVNEDLSGQPLTNVTWTCVGTGGAVCLTTSGSGAPIRVPWTGPKGSSVTIAVSSKIATNAASGQRSGTAVIPTEFTNYTISPTSSLVQRDGGLSDTDLTDNTATATYRIAAPLSVQKALGSVRVSNSDQFQVAVRTGGASGTIVSNTANATTTGSGSTVTAGTGTTGVYAGASGTTYTITEAMGAGSPSQLAQYAGRITCTDANGVQASLPQNAVFSGAQQITPAPGARISCTITNTRAPSSIAVNKKLATTRVNDSNQFTMQLRTGGAGGTVISPTTSSATTSGTGSTVAAGTGTTGAVSVSAGTSYTITEAAAGSTVLANYRATITCTDANGVQTGLPNGAAFTGSLSITPVYGAVISCDLSNGRTPPNLSLNKTNPPQMTEGTVATYALRVTNQGATDASSAVVVDKLPPYVQYQSAAGTGWSCSPSGNVADGQAVSCIYTGTIAALGGFSDLQLNVVAQAGAAGAAIVNKAVVGADGNAPTVAPATCVSTGTPAGCAVTSALPVAHKAALTLVKQVSFGTAPATAWTLRADAPSPALPGPNGATGSQGATKDVTAGATYALSESAAATYNTYAQVGSWVCATANGAQVQVQGNSVVIPTSGGNISCTVTNATAQLVLLKHVLDPSMLPKDWTITATPQSGLQLATVSATGAETQTSANTFEVRPGYAYTLSETLNLQTLAYRQIGLERQNADGSWSSVDATQPITVAAGTKATYRFVNDVVPRIVLPLTGGLSTDAFVLIGSAVLAFALLSAVVMPALRRRRQR